MTDYDSEYFFILKPDNDRLPSLVPDTNTEDRQFRFQAQPMGSAPLIFVNGWKEHDKQKRVAGLTPDILFPGADLIVRTPIREKLLAYDIPNLSIHPAVYIDDEDKWHEDFWYLTFTEMFDCWDRETSDYDQDEPPIRLGGYELHQVYSYNLNKELLDRTPLQDRLLFKMGGTLDGYVVCHKSLCSIFRAGAGGAELQSVADY